MIKKLGLGLLGVVVLFLAALYWMGSGAAGDFWEEGAPAPTARSAESDAERTISQAEAATEVGVARPKQILFGDLHVHSTFSLDAFGMALPIAGGSGAKPISHACDFARHCSSLDFWSINDHAVGITPWKWEQTVEAVRQCNAVSGNSADPDVTTFLGWEWTQVGSTPENHYGHKNVILRSIEEVPDRPVAAAAPGADDALSAPSPFLMGILGLRDPSSDNFDNLKFMRDIMTFPNCPPNIPVREQAPGCRDAVPTPAGLYSRLDDWGFESIVIPHGTAWGSYSPQGSSWDKQLVGDMHDPDRQTMIEVYSGHGSSEEYRDWRSVAFDDEGLAFCPQPSGIFVPSCWRAGEIIAERCAADGEDEATCSARAEDARQNYVEADLAGRLTVPGSTADEWLDSSQCTDCFQAAFNHRPGSSVQYIMALRNFDNPAEPRRFEFGFMASSDNHTSRPGTGYKEYARTEMTEARIHRAFNAITWSERVVEPSSSVSRPLSEIPAEIPIFARNEQERGSSFFLTGGLIAVHAEGRDRDAIWESMERKEVYGTSGPRILLWFDLLNAPGSSARTAPMGSDVTLAEAPIFQARALGSFEQKPGCPTNSISALGETNIDSICGGECYHPSDTRRPITRMEVVRIRPQNHANEPIRDLVEDPWRVIECDGDPAGCTATFTDPEFATSARDALYYVRAIEAPSDAVGADPLRCTRGADGRCISVDACEDRPGGEDCLDETEERAWSSPIFVEYGASSDTL